MFQRASAAAAPETPRGRPWRSEGLEELQSCDPTKKTAAATFDSNNYNYTKKILEAVANMYKLPVACDLIKTSRKPIFFCQRCSHALRGSQPVLASLLAVLLAFLLAQKHQTLTLELPWQGGRL